MASEIPVYESVPTERVGFDTIRVGDSLYTFDSADGAYLLSGPAPALPSPTPSLASLLDTTVANIWVLPILISTEPCACFANLPVVIVISLPSFKVIFFVISLIIFLLFSFFPLVYKIKKAIL